MDAHTHMHSHTHTYNHPDPLSSVKSRFPSLAQCVDYDWSTERSKSKFLWPRFVFFPIDHQAAADWFSAYSTQPQCFLSLSDMQTDRVRRPRRWEVEERRGQNEVHGKSMWERENWFLWLAIQKHGGSCSLKVREADIWPEGHQSESLPCLGKSKQGKLIEWLSPIPQLEKAALEQGT